MIPTGEIGTPTPFTYDERTQVDPLDTIEIDPALLADVSDEKAWAADELAFEADLTRMRASAEILFVSLQRGFTIPGLTPDSVLGTVLPEQEAKKSPRPRSRSRGK